MKKITINVPDDKVEFFMELLDQLGIQANQAPGTETDIPVRL